MYLQENFSSSFFKMKKILSFDLGFYAPYRCQNMKIFVEKAKKENKVFFTEDFFSKEHPRKWEVRFDNAYPNVFYDPYIKKYRCYYSTFTRDASSAQTSLEERKKTHYNPNTHRIVSLCYAESHDGIHFEKPSLHLVQFEGSTENNLLGEFLHGTTVFLDLYEKDPKKRYKMLTKLDYGRGLHFFAVAFSEDGIHFGEYIPCPSFNPYGDTHNFVFYDEKIGKYVLITRSWKDSLRIPCLSFSEDFLHWSEIQEIPLTQGFDYQVYSMPVFRQDEYLLGLASIYHEGDTEAENYDTVDLELAYSYNYVGFHSIEKGSPFIERGQGNYAQNASFDAQVIFASTPLVQGDKLYFYYIGGNGRHTDFREGSLARAYIEKDRYAYVAAKNTEKEAVVVTQLLYLLEDTYFLDIVCEEEGEAKIAFLDENFEPKQIKHTFEKQKDKYCLRFLEDFEEKHKSVPLRLQLSLYKAKFYAMSGSLEVKRKEKR